MARGGPLNCVEVIMVDAGIRKLHGAPAEW